MINYVMVRYTLSIIIFMCTIMILHKKAYLNRKLFCISIIVCFLISQVLTLLPIENLFYTFSSPAAVLKYYDDGYVVDVIDGVDSCMVIYQYNGEKEVYNIKIFSKNRSGYKIGTGLSYTSDESFWRNRVSLSIIHHKKSDDYYIWASTIHKNDKVELTDNKNNFFHNITINRGASGDKYYRIFAYVGSLDKNYRLYINGEEVPLNIN